MRWWVEDRQKNYWWPNFSTVENESSRTVSTRRIQNTQPSQSKTCPCRAVYEKNSEQSTSHPSTVKKFLKSCLPEELKTVNGAPQYSREGVLEELSTRRTQKSQRGTPVQSSRSLWRAVYQKNWEESTRRSSTVENELSSLLNNSTRTETESCQPRSSNASKIASNKRLYCLLNFSSP